MILFNFAPGRGCLVLLSWGGIGRRRKGRLGKKQLQFVKKNIQGLGMGADESSRRDSNMLSPISLSSAQVQQSQASQPQPQSQPAAAPSTSSASSASLKPDTVNLSAQAQAAVGHDGDGDGH